MARRQSIRVPGVAHKAPAPMGAKIGNFVYSSAIMGMDPETHITPPGNPQRQVELMFRNIREFMHQAGGTPDDILRITFLVKEDSYRDLINVEWLKMFPDADSRPARHTYLIYLRDDNLVQAELFAVL